MHCFPSTFWFQRWSIHEHTMVYHLKSESFSPLKLTQLWKITVFDRQIMVESSINWQFSIAMIVYPSVPPIFGQLYMEAPLLCHWFLRLLTLRIATFQAFPTNLGVEVLHPCGLLINQTFEKLSIGMTSPWPPWPMSCRSCSG